MDFTPEQMDALEAMKAEAEHRAAAKAAADARRPYALAQQANIERIELLIADAEAIQGLRAADGRRELELVASGVVQGLRRALNVLNGGG